MTVPCTPTQSPRSRSRSASNASSPTTAFDTNSWISPSRSRTVAKMSLPLSRMSMTRPATSPPRSRSPCRLERAVLRADLGERVAAVEAVGVRVAASARIGRASQPLRLLRRQAAARERATALAAAAAASAPAVVGRGFSAGLTRVQRGSTVVQQSSGPGWAFPMAITALPLEALGGVVGRRGCGAHQRRQGGDGADHRLGARRRRRRHHRSDGRQRLHRHVHHRPGGARRRGRWHRDPHQHPAGRRARRHRRPTGCSSTARFDRTAHRQAALVRRACTANNEGP
jgi:hypothetical protein